MKGNAPVYIVDGLRTPFLKIGGVPNPLSASELATACIKPLLLRQPFPKEAIEEVVCGCAAPEPDEMNIGRLIALRLNAGNTIKGWTVQRNCASGLQAIDSAAFDVGSGRHDLVLAGGVECMSRAPLLLPRELNQWLGAFNVSKTFKDKLLSLTQFRPVFLKPIIGLLMGLHDPTVNLSMGQTAENLAYQFGITRESMDAFSLRSHLRAVKAMGSQFLEEITPLYDWKGGVFVEDTGVRKNSTIEKLASLPPVFDRPFGTVTAGNSSQITDGAAFLILASEKAVQQYDLPILGKIKRVMWASLDPSIMGLGPVLSIAKLLEEEKLSIPEIDCWEINEAFAAQVLACLKALNDPDYCLENLKRKEPLGMIDEERLNIDGGAIAIGHPIGASGARLVLHILNILKRENKKRGIASLCIGGGQGGAILVEADNQGGTQNKGRT